MAECIYCGAELAGQQEVCRECWLAEYSELNRPAKAPSFGNRVRSIVTAAPATSLLIATNCFVFMLMVLGSKALEPSTSQLIHFGGSYLPLTLQGQWWRLLTAMFMHAGPAHLIFNMAALAQLGSIAEIGVGRRAFLITYFASGLSCSLSSEVWHSTTVSVGASGAIFGAVGLLIPLLIYRKLTVKVKRRVLSISTVLGFTVYNLVVGAITPEIDNAGHLGGFAFGLAAGLMLAYRIAPQVVEFTRNGSIRRYAAR